MSEKIKREKAPSGTLPCRDCRTMPALEVVLDDEDRTFAIACPVCGVSTSPHESAKSAIREWTRIQARSDRN